MSDRIRRLPPVLLILVSLPAIMGASGGDRGPDAAADAEHRRIIEFWTPERVAQAVPRDYVLDPGTGRFSPAKKPSGTPGGGNGGGGGGGDTGSGVVTGASWTKGGEIDGATGKVLFSIGANYYVCSAAVIQDPGDNDRSMILTAAHCVYDEGGTGFVQNWVFIPDYDASPQTLAKDMSYCDATAYGCWTPIALSVHTGFATAGGFNSQATRYDFGVVAVGYGGTSGDLLENVVTPQSYDFGTDATTQTGFAFGYPAEKKWKGNDLIYCSGPIDTDPYNGDGTYRLNECKLNGGSSGGPWLTGFSETSGSGTVISVNSYGYTGINAMHGPFLNSDTQGVYETALTGSGGELTP